MILRKKHINNFLILLPFLMVFLGEMLQISFKDTSSKIKILSAIYMILYVFINKKTNINLTLSLALFLPVFIYGIVHSFSIKAALSDGVRYLFPILVIFYSYSIRKHYKLLFKSLIIFVLINDLWQIINYINWIRGVDQWFYHIHEPSGYRYFNQVSGIIRATGIVVFFGLFGFLNGVSFFIIYKYYKGKYKKFLLTLTFISMLLSFSYKVIGPFLLVLFFTSKNKVKLIIGLLIAFVSAIIIIPKQMANIIESIVLRLQLYIFEGNSARAESYRVMMNDMLHLNLFGRGIGSFGGPASTMYNSPVYKQVNYNWFDTPGLTTTDTFYPHLFVELGLIGGLLYILILLVPIINKVPLRKITIVYIIYFLLFFDAIFSFSLNNIAYLMMSIVFIYPIIEYNKSNV